MNEAQTKLTVKELKQNMYEQTRVWLELIKVVKDPESDQLIQNSLESLLKDKQKCRFPENDCQAEKHF